MTVETKTIKCAECQVALEGPAEPKPEDTMRCPVCGEHDTVERVLAETKDYVVSKTADHFNKRLEDMVRGSSFMKLDKKFTVKRGHRFVVDYEPDLQ